MGYIVIENLQGGVDRRRPQYALPPGALWDGINCHITRGGDIEKRKAFVNFGSLCPVLPSAMTTFGLLGKGSSIYTFGSVPLSALPGGVLYQRLQHPLGFAMIGLVDADLFDGKIYAIARFQDGSVLHFYDGTLVQAWYSGVVNPGMSNNAGIATALASMIDASATYTASAAGAVVTVTAAVPGVPFTALTQADNVSSGVDDQTLTAAIVTPNVPGVVGVAATFQFQVTGGDGTGTMTNLYVGGVDTFNSTVTWATSNDNTAALIAAEVASNSGSTGWTATASGQTVTIARTTTGVGGNDQTVTVVTTNTLTINNLAAGSLVLGGTSGGATAVAAVAEVMEITVGGTYEIGDRFGVKLTSGTTTLVEEFFGNYAQPWGMASCVKTHKRKVYAGAGEFLQFSGVNTAIGWNRDVDAGAGFINASTHVGGSEEVTSLETYQGRLAVFARRAIQLWTMQNDDDLNDLNQTIENTGTRSPRSSIEFGGNDVFYLDDPGIRSLRARDASNNAFVSDVGTAIDPIVLQWVKTGATPEEVDNAVSAIEPVDNRFWMAIGSRIFVYSLFPSTKVAAWTWYELSFSPTWIARAGNRMWVRGSDDNLYLYGGSSDSEYGSDYTVTVTLPFLSVRQDGTFKDWMGMDILSSGTWSGQWMIDPNDTARVVQMGENEGVTTQGDGVWAGVGHSTHIAPKLTHSGAGYASLSKIILYHNGADQHG